MYTYVWVDSHQYMHKYRVYLLYIHTYIHIHTQRLTEIRQVFIFCLFLEQFCILYDYEETSFL